MSQENVKEELSLLQEFVNELNVFEFEEKLPGSKRLIKFKPIKTLQLKKLLQYENSKEIDVLENALDTLINSSIISEEFNINNLYMQDRLFLLFAIRIRSKGSTLETKAICEECKSQYINVIDFSNIDYTELSDNIEKTISLSKNIELNVDFITRADQKEILNYIKNIKFKNDDEKYTELAMLSLSAMIKSIKVNKKIKDNLTLKEKKYLFDESSELLIDKLKKWNDTYDFGLKLQYIKKCPHCGFEKEIKFNATDIF